jgi:hypothetical protein
MILIDGANKKLMKKLKYILLILLGLGFYTSSAQKVKLDKRVVAIRDSVVGRLINEKQYHRQYKAIFQYYGITYIKRELELFEDSLLLVRFRATNPNSKQYWGLIKKDDNLLFHYKQNENDNNLELAKYLSKCKSNTKKVILSYLNLYTQDD